MTEQSQNTVFHSSSFLQGQNAEYVEQLHARYADDPASVDASWQAFFRGLDDADADVQHSARGPSWARADWPPAPTDELTAALDGQWGPEPARTVGDKVRAKAAEVGVALTDAQVQQAVLDSLRALMIIRAYRIRGHLIADLDPLRPRGAASRTRSSTRDLRLHRGRHGPADLHRQRARPRDRVACARSSRW